MTLRDLRGSTPGDLWERVLSPKATLPKDFYTLPRFFHPYTKESRRLRFDPLPTTLAEECGF